MSERIGTAPDPGDLDRLAAEHVLGLLEGPEAERADGLLGESGFAARVSEWRERFSEFDQTATPLAAGETLWRRIESGLAAPEVKAAAVPRVVVPDPLAAFRALWRHLAFWRLAGLAGVTAAIVLGFSTVFFAQRAAKTPIMVAVLVTETGARPAALVNTFADGRAELVPLESIAVPPGRALQVWTLWDRAVGPRSIGLLDRARSVPLDLSNLPRTGQNQLFEITLEPETGSPTGRPTGPVLMKGLAVTRL